MSRSRLTAYILLLLNTALWGFSPPIIKYAFNFTNPPTFLFYRYLLATLIFFPIFLFYRIRNHHHQINIKRHFILALLGTPLTLLPLFYGLTLSTSIEASILESTSPIFVILGGLVYLREKVTPKEWLGTLLALLGTFLLVLEPLFLGQKLGTLSVQGNLLIILSNLIWATFLLSSKKNHLDPIFLSFLSFLVSIPFFLAVAFFSHTTLTLSPSALPSVLYMAIGGSIIAFWAYQEGQKRIEASEAAIFTYLKPLFTIPLAYYWLHESFSPFTLLSLLVITSGVLLSEKR